MADFYTDIDRYEDEQTVREMTRTIADAKALMSTVQRRIDSDTYILNVAEARLAAHPVEDGTDQEAGRG